MPLCRSVLNTPWSAQGSQAVPILSVNNFVCDTSQSYRSSIGIPPPPPPVFPAALYTILVGPDRCALGSRLRRFYTSVFCSLWQFASGTPLVRSTCLWFVCFLLFFSFCSLYFASFLWHIDINPDRTVHNSLPSVMFRVDITTVAWPCLHNVWYALKRDCLLGLCPLWHCSNNSATETRSRKPFAEILV